MTGATVGINSPIGCWAAAVCVAGIGLVLMLVVPKMLYGATGFVLAIDGACRPTELQRQEYQEENGEPAIHCGGSVAASVF